MYSPISSCMVTCVLLPLLPLYEYIEVERRLPAIFTEASSTKWESRLLFVCIPQIVLEFYLFIQYGVMKKGKKNIAAFFFRCIFLAQFVAFGCHLLWCLNYQSVQNLFWGYYHMTTTKCE